MTSAMPETTPVTEMGIELAREAYREGFRNGFVDATITEDGYPDEVTILKRLSEVNVSEGWDAYSDTAIAALSTRTPEAAQVAELIAAGNVLADNLWWGDEQSRNRAEASISRWNAAIAQVRQPLEKEG